MQKFTDTNGQTWDVRVTVRTVSDCRRLAEVDLADSSGDTFLRLQTDPVELVDVLYVVCKEQADAREISDVDFASIFDGDTVDSATRALLEALADFFPPHKRKALRAAWQRMRKIEELASDRITDRFTVDPITDRIMADIDRRMDATLGTTNAIQTPKVKRPTRSKPRSA